MDVGFLRHVAIEMRVDLSRANQSHRRIQCVIRGPPPGSWPMEAHMVRRTDRPLLQVRVSFEATRTGPQNLIEAYARLVPTIRRTSLRPNRGSVQLSKVTKAMAAGSRGEP
jgi:hypothetical protein